MSMYINTILRNHNMKHIFRHTNGFISPKGCHSLFYVFFSLSPLRGLNLGDNHFSLSYAKERLNNYRIQFNIPLFIAGETPASPARIRIIQTFLGGSFEFWHIQFRIPHYVSKLPLWSCHSIPHSAFRIPNKNREGR